MATTAGTERIPRNHDHILPREDLWKILGLPMVAFLGLPLVAIFFRISLEDLLINLRAPQVLQAIGLSLLTSTITALIALIFGTPVAYALAHQRAGLSRFVDTLVDLPTVLPPAVAGVALLMAFGRRGLIGIWLARIGIEIPFTPVAVVMAQTFVAAPFFIKTASTGFASVSAELLQAAALDGAGHWRVFRHISLPLAGFSLLSGCLMTWARALGEFGATIIFAGNYPGRTQTMPLAIFVGFEIDLEVALTLALILVLTSFLTLILIKGFLHRKVFVDYE